MVTGLAITFGRYLLAAIFLFAGGVHYMHIPLFVGMEDDYRIVPFSASVYFGEAVPRIEILLGVFLLVGRWLIEAYTAAVALLSVFLVATVMALYRGLDISCGCWGTESPPISWWHAGFQLLLIAFSAVALRLQCLQKGGENHGTSILENP